MEAKTERDQISFLLKKSQKSPYLAKEIINKKYQNPLTKGISTENEEVKIEDEDEVQVIAKKFYKKKAEK